MEYFLTDGHSGAMCASLGSGGLCPLYTSILYLISHEHVGLTQYLQSYRTSPTCPAVTKIFEIKVGILILEKE